jgi:hypothetical protein
VRSIEVLDFGIFDVLWSTFDAGKDLIDFAEEIQIDVMNFAIGQIVDSNSLQTLVPFPDDEVVPECLDVFDKDVFAMGQNFFPKFLFLKKLVMNWRFHELKVGSAFVIGEDIKVFAVVSDEVFDLFFARDDDLKFARGSIGIQIEDFGGGLSDDVEEEISLRTGDVDINEESLV